jgi:hypothetical protein
MKMTTVVSVDPLSFWPSPPLRGRHGSHVLQTGDGVYSEGGCKTKHTRSVRRFHRCGTGTGALTNLSRASIASEGPDLNRKHIAL